MKIYNTQSEIEADIKNGELFVDDDITITFDCTIDAGIIARNINALNIKAWDIKAWDINALNIDADDIKARNINAVSISYYAICVAFHTFTCQKIEGTRKNAKHFCLDGDIKILTGE